jgi:hypothetical protein
MQKCQLILAVFVNQSLLRMKKIFFLLLCLLSWKSTIAQNTGFPPSIEGNPVILSDTLPSLARLEAALQMYHNRLWTVEREEFLIKEKFRLFKYLPSLGMAPLSRAGELSFVPLITFNSREVFSYFQIKGQQKVRLLSLDRKATLVFNEALLQLRLAFRRYEKEAQALVNTRKLAAIEDRHFAIYAEALRKREMKVVDFLEKEKAHLTFLAQAAEQQKALELLRLQVLEKARFGLEEVPLYLEDGADCILLSK